MKISIPERKSGFEVAPGRGLQIKKPSFFVGNMCKSDDLCIENDALGGPRALWCYVLRVQNADLLHFAKENH